MSLTVHFGLAIRQYRESLRISQEEFAHRAGLDRTYVSGIERGCRNPSLKTIGRLATALNISLDKLFETVVELGYAEEGETK